MARITSTMQLRGLTTPKLNTMNREDKITLLVKGTDALRKNIENLKKYINQTGEKSQFLEKRKISGKPLPKGITLKQASKMTDTQLDKALIQASRDAKAKTATKSGVKAFNKHFKEMTGRNYSDISSDTWEKIRKEIEKFPYGSEEIIEAYFEDEDADEEQLEENLQRISNGDKEDFDEPF